MTTANVTSVVATHHAIARYRQRLKLGDDVTDDEIANWIRDAVAQSRPATVQERAEVIASRTRAVNRKPSDAELMICGNMGFVVADRRQDGRGPKVRVVLTCYDCAYLARSAKKVDCIACKGDGYFCRWCRKVKSLCKCGRAWIDACGRCNGSGTESAA